MSNGGELAGKVALVTGANTGIGKVTALELALRGAHVFIACRSTEKSAPVALELTQASGREVELLTLDLADLTSVRAAAKAFLERGLPLHLLVNNAGLAGQRGLTRSGFELGFGVNHVGHFLLTSLLLDRLRSSAPARIVNVASRAHYQAKGIDWHRVRAPTRALSGLPEYAVAKLANVLFSAELARRLAGTGVTTYSLHPGVVATEVWRAVPWPVQPIIKRFMLTSEEGARTTLHCALSPEAGRETGLYYDTSRPVEPSRVARDAGLAEELYRKSEEWTR